MGVSSPRLVTVGLPLYNEARHVDAALKALRAQDYPRLEIIVCDNASTDETLAICRAHAAVDQRIRIETVTEAISVTDNFRRAVTLANGDFFMWASGHDLWSPGLISECVSLLESHPGACLAYGSADWIGPDGEPLDRESGWTDTRGLGPAGRFLTVLWGNMHPALGVMRIQALRECGPLAAMVGADLLLLSAMALRGDFLHATASGWSRRDLRSETNHHQKVRRYISSEFGIVRSRLGRMFPMLALPMALMRLVIRSDLGLLDRVGLLLVLVPSLALRYRVGRQSQPR
jgi:glycosyltransferase involved in cell wall biosynthesis